MEEKVKFAFPTVVRCPRCRGTNTRAYSTQGKIQYRFCQAPICRHRFSIRGEPIEDIESSSSSSTGGQAKKQIKTGKKKGT